MKNDSKNIIKFMLCIVLLLIAYLPTGKWMIARWMAPESYYGHGFLIPLISLYVVWQRKELLKKTAMSSSGIGLVIVIAGLLVHMICASLKVYFVSGFSFVFVLYGLVLFCFGREMARNLIFPIFFLFAMIPIPLVLIGNLTVKLKLFAAQLATVILNKIGFPSIRDGSIITMPNSQIAVEAPCSGLRSLIALITLGVVFSFAMKVSYIKKSTLIVLSLPIAISANILRILALAIVNDLYGGKVAMGFFHDFMGFMVFGIAFAGMFIVGRILEPIQNENE